MVGASPHLNPMPESIRVGLIADTHDLLRPAVMKFLSGCNHIIHAGDICSSKVLDELTLMAPVISVLGNNDKGEWARSIPKTEIVKIGGIHLYAIHDLSELDIEPAAAGVSVVVSGHSHKPSIEKIDGVLYVNPGSAGPRRFRLPISAAELFVDGTEIIAKIKVFSP